MVALKMKCDSCNERNLHEVFVLRKNKFSIHATNREKKYSRVCWSCARLLFKRKLYNFGHNWRNIFLDNSFITDKNKLKLMVIHA